MTKKTDVRCFQIITLRTC